MVLSALTLASAAGDRAHNVGHLLLYVAVVLLVLGMAAAGLLAICGIGTALARFFQTNPAIPWLAFLFGLLILALGYIAGSGVMMLLGGGVAGGLILYGLAQLDG